MNYMDKACALREDPNVHYNCCQSVLIPFAEKLGLSEEQAAALGAHFGSGMRYGSTCGALTGALMAAGLLGKDAATTNELICQFRERNGYADCRDLLEAAADRGQPKKENCDELVYQCVRALEALLQG